jgi:hypothetical protein
MVDEMSCIDVYFVRFIVNLNKIGKIKIQEMFF